METGLLLFSLDGRSMKSSILDIIDSQSVKWENNKTPNDIDGNKKIKGIKRCKESITPVLS